MLAPSILDTACPHYRCVAGTLSGDELPVNMAASTFCQILVVCYFGTFRKSSQNSINYSILEVWCCYFSLSMHQYLLVSTPDNTACCLV